MILYCIIGYYSLINLFSFILMEIDKNRAIKKKWRVPEKHFFFYACLGGAFGATLGMYAFRHKTRHWYFVVFMPLLLVLHIIFLIFLIPAIT